MNKHKNYMIVKMIRRHGIENDNVYSMTINNEKFILIHCRNCKKGFDNYCKMSIENYNNWEYDKNGCEHT